MKRFTPQGLLIFRTVCSAILTLICLLSPSLSFAQKNIVLNGDFEEIANPFPAATTSPTHGFDHGASVDWTGICSDLYSLLNPNLQPLPISPYTHQAIPAYSGKSYAGVGPEIQAWDANNVATAQWNEYMFGKLDSKLFANIKYDLSMRITRAITDDCPYASRDIGFKFKDSQFDAAAFSQNFYDNGNQLPISISNPELVTAVGTYPNPTPGDWQLVENPNYIANGTETQLIAGIMNTQSPIPADLFSPQIPPTHAQLAAGIAWCTYYLVDAVNVSCQPQDAVALIDNDNTIYSCGQAIPVTIQISNSVNYQILLQQTDSNGTPIGQMVASTQTISPTPIGGNRTYTQQIPDIRALFPTVNFCTGGHFLLYVQSQCNLADVPTRAQAKINVIGGSSQVTSDGITGGQFPCGYPVNVSGSTLNATGYQWILQELSATGTNEGNPLTGPYTSTNGEATDGFSVPDLSTLLPNFVNGTGKQYTLTLRVYCCGADGPYQDFPVNFSLGDHPIQIKITTPSIDIDDPSHLIFDYNNPVNFQYSGDLTNPSYVWSFPGSNDTSGDQSSENRTWQDAGQYNVQLTATDPQGCYGKANKEIEINHPAWWIPNAFSPNGDGNNDTFGVINSDETILKFDIFDRWGELVFSAVDPKLIWDGRYKGRLVDPGVFVMYAEIRTTYHGQYSAVFHIKKSVTVIR